ncbi:MAG TPA: alpha/beta hydrolase [Thermoanaerobaculia bacterium]|jgi:pimeloyl-ACP methyl ester carboxylesterase|nr:alpha/beta hydrolase [Thermoanaerobaculia bacterium]
MQGSFHHRFPGGIRLVSLLILLPVLAGCVRYLPARLRPTPVPLHVVRYPGPAPAAGQPRTLVVLLPGRWDRPQDFGKYSFPEIAARAGVHVDMVAVDAHLNYYLQNMIVDRLREDVIGPARQHYDRIWLVGISIGGTGAVLYASQHPEDLDGVVLFAPYLGEDPMIDEVAAGSLASWHAPKTLAPDDFQHRIWVWLQGYAKGPAKFPLYLGWGETDSFARGNGLVAKELPKDRVFTATGGHEWKAWKALWEQFVRTGALVTAQRKIR